MERSGRQDTNLRVARGVAIRELPLERGHGFADYLLYVDAKAAGGCAPLPTRMGGCSCLVARIRTRRRCGAHLRNRGQSGGPSTSSDAKLLTRFRHTREGTCSPDAPEARWRSYGYDELLARDKASLDIFWLRDESLADCENLPSPDVIAQEIVDDMAAALEQFRPIADDTAPSGREAIESR